MEQPEHIDRYEIRAVLGKGAMGSVYCAFDPKLHREVALKVVADDLARESKARERFQREARAIAALKHPNIVEIYDYSGEDSEHLYLVMEKLDGDDLFNVVNSKGMMPEPCAAAVGHELCLALQTAHDAGVIHRDLKPANIFLAACDVAGGRPVPKLLDFGIAKVFDPAQLGSETEVPPTRTGALLGTPAYMSFEQAMSDKQVDCRTDIWSLGVILFEALAGHRPLAFETLGEMYVALLQGMIPRAADAIPELPLEVANLIDRCLVRDKVARLDRLSPFIETLGAHADGIESTMLATDERPIGRPATIESVPLETHAGTSPWRRAKLAATIVVGIAGAAGVAAWSTHRPSAAGAIGTRMAQPPAIDSPSASAGIVSRIEPAIDLATTDSAQAPSSVGVLERKPTPPTLARGVPNGTPAHAERPPPSRRLNAAAHTAPTTESSGRTLMGISETPPY